MAPETHSDRIPIREQPWQTRRAFHSHHRWYQDLLSQHRLTLEWLREAKLERPSHFLGPSVRPEVRESVLALERVADRALESETGRGLDALLDDSAPEDSLGRLENSILTLQAWALQTLAERSPESLEALEQKSWREGSHAAAARGGEIEREDAGPLDLREIAPRLLDNPILGRPEREPVLIRRLTRSNIELELRRCPHQSANPAVQQAADSLCRLQAFWLKGYLYGFAPQLLLDYEPGTDGRRCALQVRGAT